MSRPDWNDAPEWANYLAQDKNGGWYWYEARPIRYGHSWSEEGQAAEPAYSRTEDWSKSLEPKPTT
jgi:hypothetical protein